MEAVRFIRETGAPVARPELLDMPEVAIAQGRAIGRDTLFDVLTGGDASAARGWLLSRYLGGTSIAELCDGPLREAMHRLGELWHHGSDGVFVEHRATDTCLQALAHLRNMLDVSAEAPVATGATPQDDPYILPSFMAATVIAEAGMRAVNLGPDTPVSAMQHAFVHHQPRLVWISASAPIAPERARELAHWLVSLPESIIAVVGGRAGATIAMEQPGVRRIDTMVELAAVVAGIVGHRAA
ncbi:MAG: B12-binding domain-containing protein [Deltaproteobacteria bacterium]